MRKLEQLMTEAFETNRGRFSEICNKIETGLDAGMSAPALRREINQCQASNDEPCQVVSIRRGE